MFQVMDKEPSLSGLAIWYGALCAIAYIASRKRWWLGLFLLPVIAVFSNIAEVLDPYVGPAILREAGHKYVNLSSAMLFAALAFTVFAALRYRKAQRTH